MRNGYWHVGALAPSWKATTTGLLKLSDSEWRKFYLRDVELGIINSDTRANELREYVRDAANSTDSADYVFNTNIKRTGRFKKLARGITSTAAKLYQAGDDFWKVYGHENEKVRLRKSFPKLSEEQVEEQAAKIVLDVHPSESRVPEGVRALRKLPFIAPFATFPAEIIRSTYHTLERASIEMRDPRTRQTGAERIVGMILALSTAKAISSATRFYNGITKDEEDALREFVPPWQKNSQYAYLSKSGAGKIRYVDLAYSDPHNTLITPIKAFMKGEDFRTGLWEGLKDVSQPFTGEDILFKAITEAWRNHTDSGGAVYNQEDSVDQQAMDITLHVEAAFEPGTITSARRIVKGIKGEKSPSGKAYNPGAESAAMITGQRIADLDVKQSMIFKAKTFMGRLRDADNIFYRPLTTRGTVSKEDLISTYRRTDEARRQIFRDGHTSVKAAIALGLTNKEIAAVLISSGMPNDDARAIMAGIYRPTKITKGRIEAIRKANPEDAEMRIQALHEARGQRNE
jgi:hypothetical protein